MFICSTLRRNTWTSEQKSIKGVSVRKVYLSFRRVSSNSSTRFERPKSSFTRALTVFNVWHFSAAGLSVRFSSIWSTLYASKASLRQVAGMLIPRDKEMLSWILQSQNVSQWLAHLPSFSFPGGGIDWDTVTASSSGREFYRLLASGHESYRWLEDERD